MKLKLVKQANPMVWQVRAERSEDPNDWYVAGDLVGSPEFAKLVETLSEFYERVQENIETIERELELAERYGEPMPKIVCLCGSTRFSEAFQQANFEETLAGNIVLTIGCDTKADAELFSGEEGERKKQMLDELHLRKIQLADEILVLNVGGYVGNSTSREIAHAQKLGRGIRFLEVGMDIESAVRCLGAGVSLNGEMLGYSVRAAKKR